MDQYLAGKKLYGDDFSIGQIEKWYEEEAEGYADLGYEEQAVEGFYGYHNLNKIHGFTALKNLKFEQALGFGSAHGLEFMPLIDQIEALTMVEPSEQLKVQKVGNITPKYVKPTLEGTLPFPDNSFDLITCFGTLHHVANVSFVLSELIRVMKPGGYFLVREPIISMGDWNVPRPGLSANERGIPIGIFDEIFRNQPVEVVSRNFVFTMTAFLQRKIGHWFDYPLHYYASYIRLDKVLSSLLSWNTRYHATNFLQRISPSNVFFVLRKK